MTDDSQENCKCDLVASTVEPVIEVGEVKKRRRQRQEHRGAGGRTSVIREQVTDVDMALRELESAKAELAQVPEHLKRWERKKHPALVEPMSRVQLVMRFLRDVLERNGWEAP